MLFQEEGYLEWVQELLNIDIASTNITTTSGSGSGSGSRDGIGHNNNNSDGSDSVVNERNRKKAQLADYMLQKMRGTLTHVSLRI